MLLLLFSGPAPASPGGPFTLEPAAVLVDFVAAGVGGPRTRPPEFPDDGSLPRYRVVPVTMRGAVLGALEHATGISVVKTLGAEDEFAFSSPKADPDTNVIELLSSEVQIYRGPSLKTWGPVLGDHATSGGGAVEFSGRGVWWYFKRRYFGTANRRNMIRNGDFEAGLSGWRAHGSAVPEVLAPGNPVVDPLTGTKAIGFFGTPGQNNYLGQEWPYFTTWPPGQLVTVVAWCYVDTWAGPAAFGLGLYIAWKEDGEVRHQGFAGIDASTPRGKWVRLEATVVARPYVHGTLEARLYAPGGTIVWDAARAVLMESTSGDFAGSDQTELARRIVVYGQGPTKGSLHVGTDTPPTGVIRRRAWQHAEHAWLNEAVENDLALQPDGFDFRVDLTPTTRTFRTYFPRIGVDRRATLTLRTGPILEGGNLASWSRGRDGASVADSVVTRAPGEGPDREEGVARDLAGLDGLVLEDVVDAPDTLEIDELDAFAADELAGRKVVIPVIEAVLHRGARIVEHGVEVELLEVLSEPGDLVGLLIDDGYVQVDADYRIVRTSLNGASDTLTLTLNRWED